MTRGGRGKSPRSLALIESASIILNEIRPATVRAVCYQLFTRKRLTSMARSETNRVSRQLTDARESGDIPWSWIVDETREPERVSAWADPAAFVDTVKHAYRRDRWADQPQRVEVWSEKGTVRGTLSPVLQDYGVTFRVMHGYGSATALYDVAQESLTGPPLDAVYVGDWDPSGLHMSQIDLPTRIARYGGAVTIERVALTRDHTRDLGWAPSFEVNHKRLDPRYQWFRRQHGSRCWELDALNPVTLRQAVEQAIRDRIDPARWNQGATTEQAELESLASILRTWPGISRQASE